MRYKKFRVGESYIVAIIRPWYIYVRLLTVRENMGDGNMTAKGYGTVTSIPVSGGFVDVDYYQQNGNITLLWDNDTILLKKYFRGKLPDFGDNHETKRILLRFMKEHHKALHDTFPSFQNFE